MVNRFMTLLGLPVVLLGLALTCDLQSAYAQSGATSNRGIGNRPEVRMGGRVVERYAWRGKTYRNPLAKQMEGVVVVIREPRNRVFEADIWLYSSSGAPSHKLELKETYMGESLEFRVKAARPGKPNRPEHRKNDELNLVLDVNVRDTNGMPICDDGKELMRRILLTASRPRSGNAQDSERTVRFVTYTYLKSSDGSPCSSQAKSATSSDETGKGALPQQNPDDQGKNGDRDGKPKPVSFPPCSDYPDDAVLIETEIEPTGVPVMPTDPWLDYTDWDL